MLKNVRDIDKTEKNVRAMRCSVFTPVAFAEDSTTPSASSPSKTGLDDGTSKRGRKILTSAVANALWTRSFCHRAAVCSLLPVRETP